MDGHCQKDLDSFLHHDDVALFPVLHLSLDKFGGSFYHGPVRLFRFNEFFKSVEADFLLLPLSFFKFAHKFSGIEPSDSLNSLFFAHA